MILAAQVQQRPAGRPVGQRLVLVGSNGRSWEREKGMAGEGAETGGGGLHVVAPDMALPTPHMGACIYVCAPS